MMDNDYRLSWIENRIQHSLKVKIDELKSVFKNDQCRKKLRYFLNVAHCQQLFVFHNNDSQLTLSTESPVHYRGKGMLFCKLNSIKLTMDNIDQEISTIDLNENIIEFSETIMRDIFLPLACANPVDTTKNYNLQEYHDSSHMFSDKMLDTVHRLIANLQVADGFIKDQIVLVQPNLDVLQDVLNSEKRRTNVLHVLETTVINWCKQIKVILLRENITKKQSNPQNTPLIEIGLWKSHLETVVNVQKQLHLPITKEILANLERVDSQYYHSFVNLMIEISEEKLYTKDMLKYLNPISNWFEKFESAEDTENIVKLIPPLLRLVFLLWKFNKYYHNEENIYRFLKIFTNKVIEKVYSVLGDYKSKDAKENLQNFKSALKICAKFRGTYLDTRDLVDQVNQEHEKENADLINNSSKGDMWKTKVYGPHAFKSQYRIKTGDNLNNVEEDLIDELCLVSVWPARNSQCFTSLNQFIQRCNDCVELLQSSEHFRSLSDVAKIGGASTRILNSMVTELDNRFQLAMKHFNRTVYDILDLKNSATFERAFFEFRSVVKDLEKALGLIIDNSLDVCPTVESKLHLIEVFEGMSGREIIQKILAPKLQVIIGEFKIEIQEIHRLVEQKEKIDQLLDLKNTPQLINRLITLRSFKERISKPLNQLLKIFPNALIGDAGWILRRSIDDVLDLCTNTELTYIDEWNKTISPELTECLRQSILILENSDMSADGPPQLIINIDHSLVTILREIKYLLHLDPNFKLSETCESILRSTEGINIDLFMRKLNLIVFQFNYAMHTMSIFERNLLIKDLEKINELLQAGSNFYCWKMPESIDFIEKLMFLVSHELSRKLIVIQKNLDEIIEIGNSWSRGNLDIFSACDLTQTNITWKLQESHKKIEEEIQLKLNWSQSLIEKITESTLNVIEINQDSPSWINYMEFLDAMLLESIKSSVLMSLSSLQMHVNRDINASPLLSVNLDLCNNEISFLIPLFPTINRPSIGEIVMNWVNDYLNRSKFIKMINKNIEIADERDISDLSFNQFIKEDEEIKLHISKIEGSLERTIKNAAKVLELFNDYSFLWIPKIDESFENFLSGSITPNPLRSSSRANYRSVEMFKSRGDSRTSSSVSKLNPADEEQAERSFLTPKNMQEIQANNIPCLDDFNTEIDLYRTAIEELEALPDYKDCGCLRIILDPLRQVLVVYAQSWIWKYSQFLCEQVSYMLLSLQQFLSRVEPLVDSITGEERDTVSFMRLMRVFNEISTQQAITQNKFSVMNKAVDIIQLYSPNLLQDDIIQLYQTIPDRWTNLKTKVSLAKQRLGPRIQEESETVSKDLIDFRKRVDKFEEELHSCEAYHFDCPLEGARVMLENFDKRVLLLKNEASDLIELQNLLDNNIVNFDTIKRCMMEIFALKEVWEANRKIQNEQQEWKRHRWQRMNPEFLLEATDKQLEIVEKLPEIIKVTDIWIRLKACINDIRICIPLLTDLSSKTMRTRHWKQMVRATGGAIHVDSEVLKNMTFGELLSLGLQKHLSEVKAIVERANQDLKIENSLKTYEEVWLSKIFQFNVQKLQEIIKDEKRENSSDNFNGDLRESGSHLGRRSIVSSRNIISSSSKHRSRTVSTISLPHSLTQLLDSMDETIEEDISLICNTEEIFTQLDEHQNSLESMANDNTAIGSFLDDVLKWKGQLRNIESVLRVWLKVQQMWKQLYQVFLWQEIQDSLNNETIRFKSIQRDFILLMMATKRNPNVLQCCNRKNMEVFLQDIYSRLNSCYQIILNYLSKREHSFAKLYLLSNSDVFELVGSDLNSFGNHLDKIWPYVESLKVQDCNSTENDLCSSKITAIITKNKETIYLNQPIALNESIETCLLKLETEIRSTLTAQLIAFLDKQKSLGDCINIKEDISQLVDITQEDHTHDVSKRCCQIDSLGLRILATQEVDLIMKAEDSSLQIEDTFQKFTNILSAFNEITLKISAKSSSDEGNNSDLIKSLSLKLQTLIGIISDYCVFISDFVGSKFDKTNFIEEWSGFPKYYFHNQDDSVTVTVNLFNNTLEYGFDITPLCDKYFGFGSINKYDLSNVLFSRNDFVGAICYTNREEIVDSILYNIASCMGKYFYSVDCSKEITHRQIIQTLKSHFLIDSWICLKNFDRLSQELKTVFHEIFSKRDENEADNEPFYILGEKLNIKNTSKGTLLLTLDRLIPQFSRKTDYLKSPIVFSSLTGIPIPLMEQLRLVTIRHSSLSKQIALILYRTGFKHCGVLSKSMSDFIHLVDTRFSIQIYNKDAIIVNLMSGFFLTGLGNKLKLSLLRSSSNESDSIIVEKRIICEELKDKYLNILLSDKHEYFIQCFNDFWKINPEECHSQTTESSFNDMLNNLLCKDGKLKTNYLLTNQLKNHIEKIYNSLCHSKIIGIVGSTGCGKSSATKIAIEMRKIQLQKEILVEKIYPNSYSDLCHYSQNSESNRNIFQSLLMQINLDRLKRNKIDDVEYGLIIDGKFSINIVESISNCINGNYLVLNNGNRLVLPPNFHIIFEFESMNDLHPGFVSHMALVYCNQDKKEFIQNDWKVLFQKVLNNSPIKETLNQCLENTIPSLLNYIDETTEQFTFHADYLNQTKHTKMVRIIKQSFDGALSTLANYLSSLLVSSSKLVFDSAAVNNLIAYSALWAFGGYLLKDTRDLLSDAIKKLYNLILAPEYEQYSLFDLHLDIDKMKWYPWSELIAPQVVNKNSGLILDRVVKTPSIEACNMNLSILSDNGFPVLLIGGNGCGKSSIIKERLKTLCSGEVADILNISIDINIYAKSTDISGQLNNNIQWQHGSIYSPTGNKKLIIFLDDLNSSRKDSTGGNAINELTREILDSDGFWHYENRKMENCDSNHETNTPINITKKQLRNINIMATLNTEKITSLDQRMLRHFNIIHVPRLSLEDQRSIFSVLVKGHLFGTSIIKAEINNQSQINGFNISEFIDQLIKITIDLQERLNQQFKMISKPVHYLFNLYSLVQVFYNFCETVSSDTDLKTLLYAWRSECNWIYQNRMVDIVHINKYIEAYEHAVKGELAEKYKNVDLPMLAVLDPHLPIFSGMKMPDNGFPSTVSSINLGNDSMEESETTNLNSNNNSNLASNGSNKQLSYGPIFNEQKLSDSFQVALNEYNKIYPPIYIYMHRTNINIISRVSRILTLNQNMGHCLIVADGTPGLSTTLMKLSAFISGYQVVFSNSKIINSHDYSIESFKNELNNYFTIAGSKNEKIVMIIRDGDLTVPGVTQCIRNFVINVSIDDLFTIEQKTHLINAVRTEVVKSGLNFSRDVAWKFFIQNVIKNFRFVIVINNCHSASFYSWMQHNSQLIGKMNVIWNMCWNKQEMIANSRYIIESFSVINKNLSNKEKENCSYLLYNIHTATQEFDLLRSYPNVSDPVNKSELNQMSCANNTTFERFIVKFCQLMEKKLFTVENEEKNVTDTLLVITEQEQLAARLFNQLNHEKQVLQDKIDAATSILNQIGENTLIVQSQMKTIYAQINEIKQLKKLVPEYKLAHDRFSYKAIAAFNQARDVVKNIDIDNLTELRSIHNPTAEVVELIETIIMILKSPSSDMTWNTGGKRLLANLERFTLDLLTFDERRVTDETLSLLEPRLMKSSMQSDVMKEKSGMQCCGDLCKWAHFVVRYYKIMQNKVKPLHQRLEQTTKEVAEAEVRMKLLNEKRKNLNARLQDLSNNFEQATLDRYNQEIKSAKVTEMLVTSKSLIELLDNEKQSALTLKSSYKTRKYNLFGSCTVSSGFVTYLGQFDTLARRELLCAYWPKCLQERGLNLTFDIVDKVEGLKTLFEYPSLNQNSDRKDEKEIFVENEEIKSATTSGYMENINLPFLSDDQYSNLITAIGSFVCNKRKDDYLEFQGYSNFDIQQSVLIAGNEDRFSVIIDPSSYAMKYFKSHWKLLNKLLTKKCEITNKDLLQIIYTDMITPQIFLNRMEESVINGYHTVIHMDQPKLDSFVESFIQFFSSKSIKDQEFNSKLIKFGNRRATAEDGFICLLLTDKNTLTQDTELSSQVNFVNWKVKESQIIEIMAEKCFLFIGDNFSKIQNQRKLNERHRHHLTIFMQELQSILIRSNRSSGRLWNDANIESLKLLINNIKELKIKISKYNEFVKTCVEHKSKIKKQLMKIEVVLQCITNFGNINSNVSFTPTVYLKIFERLMSENSQFDFKVPLNNEDTSDKQNDSLFMGRPSITALSGKIEEESILKWSSTDQIDHFEASEEDDKQLVEQLLNSVDTEEKRSLAQEITGIRSSKSQFKLKSFEFYMRRRGVIRPRPWKPEKPSQFQDTLSTTYQDDKFELSERLQQIQNLTSQNEINDNNDSKSDTEFKLLTEESLKSLVGMFEDAVLQRLRLCLSKDEFSIYRFIYYLWLSEDPINVPSSMELEFFIHGFLKPEMKLSLLDFDCTYNVPNWISTNMWDEILAASVLPGPLGELCVKVAENSEDFRTWFEMEDIENQETTPLDLNQQNLDNETVLRTKTNKFTKLMLLRIFRPDRCKIFMEKMLSEPMSKDHTVDFDTIIKQNLTLKCILVSKNSVPSPDSLFVIGFENENLLEIIQKSAEKRSLEISIINCATCSKDQLYSLLENDARKSDWIVITFIETVLNKLAVIKQLMKNLITSKDSTPKLVWIISEETQKIVKHFNSDILDNMLVLSEENMKQMLLIEDNQIVSNQNIVLGKIFQCTLSAFHYHNSLLLEVLNKAPNEAGKIIWRLVYINSIIMLRQSLGSRGIATWKQLSLSFIKDQLLYLKYNNLQFSPEDQMEIDLFIKKLIEFIFIKLYFDNTDKEMIQGLSRILFKDISENEIGINGIRITFPLFKTDLTENIRSLASEVWFTDTNINGLMCLEYESSKDMNLSVTYKILNIIESFLNSLIDVDFDAEKSQSFDDKYLSKENKRIWFISKNKLRAKALYVSEKLPNFIDPSSLNVENTQVNYLEYSSVSTKLDLKQSEKMIQMNQNDKDMYTKMVQLFGLTITEEIKLFNQEIYKIKTQLHHIYRIANEDLVDMEESLVDTCCDIISERVPQSWVMLTENTYVPTIHRLTSYIEYLTKRQQYLINWSQKIKKLITISSCSFPSLWLAGLKNPKNILTGIKSTFAITKGKDIEKTEIIATFSDTHRLPTGISLTDSFLIGAFVNLENGKIVLSKRTMINKLERIYIHSVCIDDLDPTILLYKCPVYTDLSRTQLTSHILMPCLDTELLLLSGVFMVLDTGTDIKQLSKEKIPVLIPPSITVNDSSTPIASLTRKIYEDKFTVLHTLPEEDENVETTRDHVDTGKITDISDRSESISHLSSDQKSQIESKKFSPLPPEMGLVREKINLIDDNNQKVDSYPISEENTERTDSQKVKSNPVSESNTIRSENQELEESENTESKTNNNDQFTTDSGPDSSDPQEGNMQSSETDGSRTDQNELNEKSDSSKHSDIEIALKIEENEKVKTKEDVTEKNEKQENIIENQEFEECETTESKTNDSDQSAIDNKTDLTSPQDSKIQSDETDVSRTDQIESNENDDSSKPRKLSDAEILMKNQKDEEEKGVVKDDETKIKENQEYNNEIESSNDIHENGNSLNHNEFPQETNNTIFNELQFDSSTKDVDSPPKNDQDKHSSSSKRSSATSKRSTSSRSSLPSADLSDRSNTK